MSIKVRVDSASESNPVEVYMVVNQYNAGSVADSTAVMHGHVGTDRMIQVDETPYLKLTDNQEHVISTDVAVQGDSDIDVFFVLKDGSGVSATPTKIVYGKSLAEEVDLVPPFVMSAYINQARDAIYLHINDDMDPSSVPAPSAFALTGVVGASVTGVTLTQVENLKEYYPYFYLVKLDVTGLGGADISQLKVSYTPPTDNPLRDNSTAHNAVTTFTQNVKTAAVTLSTEKVEVSSDGRYIYFNTTNCAYFAKDTEDFSIQVTDEAGAVLNYSIDDQSWTNSGNGMSVWLVRGDAAAPSGNVTVMLTPVSGMVDFAMDPITQAITATGTPAETALSIASADYNTGTGKLTVTFNGAVNSSASPYSCSFQLFDGTTTYTLRGKPNYDSQAGTLVFSDYDLPVTPQAGWKLIYNEQHPDSGSHSIVTEPSGKPLEHTEVSVTIS